MKKNNIVVQLFEGNKFVLVCVFFTLATIVDIVLSTINGFEQYITFKHLIDRLLICTAPILPLIIFNYFEKLSVWALFPIHYAISCAAAMLYIFVQSFIWEIHNNAYIDIFRSYTMMYIIVVAGAMIIDLCRTAKANRYLKKINKKNAIKKGAAAVAAPLKTISKICGYSVTPSLKMEISR